MSANGFVPVIDLGPTRGADPGARAALAGEVGRACTDSGFLVVVNHGVPAELIAAVSRATEEFFALPAAEKRAILADPQDPLMRGYGQSGAVGEDLQTFVMNRLGEPELIGATESGPDIPNRWPAALPAFRTAYLGYYTALERLAMDLMRLFALALDLPGSWFDDKFDHHSTSLAANFYPPRPDGPPPGHRKAEHTDWGTLTILYRDESAGGLQVLDRDGRWLEVPAVPGAFVVNIGDLMALWTNDRWTSTVHRVVHPAGEQAHRARYSIAFFHQPNQDALISCIPTCSGPDDPPRHEALTCAQYLTRKARRAYIHRHMLTRAQQAGAP